MKTVLLNGMYNMDAQDTQIADVLCQSLDDADHDLKHFVLKDLDIKPCRSCGACGHKTPGECAVNDDMEPLLRAVANCDIIVFLTPVTFGGYSAVLKKAVDKFMVLGEAMYIVEGGHMLHPMRYGRKQMIVVGVEQTPEQRESFATLAAHNAFNMQSTVKTVFVPQGGDKTSIQQILRSVVSEVAS